MNIQQKEFIRFIKLLADNDCLEYVILIGSWAEFLYRELGILQKFEPNIKTLDIDFLLKNLRRPIPEKNIIPLAKAAGYLIESDRLYGTTKIYDKYGLEIEFLINQLGAGSESTLKTNLGVAAQALRHLHILSANALSVVYLGFTISIPKPEAYAIHKMVINQIRLKSSLETNFSLSSQHIKDFLFVCFGCLQEIVILNDISLAYRQFFQFSFEFRHNTPRAVIVTASRSEDDVFLDV